MKLTRHRADLRWLAAHLPHREVDVKGCVLCQVIKRYKHSIQVIEEEKDGWVVLTAARARLLKDAGGK